MADNVDVTPGTGKTFATDDIGGVQYPRAKLSLGADGTAVDAVAGAGNADTGTQRVIEAADSPLISAITASEGYSASVALTRTNDTNAYTANDVVGAATGSTAALTFSSMGPSAGRIIITGARFSIDAAAIISGETSYILHLYNVTPPGALGDNAAWDLPSGDRTAYLGFINLGTPVDLGSTLYVELNSINKQIKLASTSLFGYLVTVGAHTPTAQRVYNIELQAIAL